MPKKKSLEDTPLPTAPTVEEAYGDAMPSATTEKEVEIDDIVTKVEANLSKTHGRKITFDAPLRKQIEDAIARGTLEAIGPQQSNAMVPQSVV